MNALQLQAHIQQGRAIAFDTNSLWRRQIWAQACGRLRAWAREHGLQPMLVVPAIVHTEHVLHMRHERGASFSPTKVEEALASIGLTIVALDRPTAEAVAEVLAGRYPEPHLWQQAKRAALPNATPASGDAAGPAPTSPRRRRVPMTTDWLIAGQAVAGDWILVCDDTGPEFREDVQRVPLDDFVAAVDQLASL